MKNTTPSRLHAVCCTVHSFASPLFLAAGEPAWALFSAVLVVAHAVRGILLARAGS